MLTIQYISDIHLEFRYNLPKIKALADILVLAGDIGDPRSKIYKWFLSDVSSKFKKIFLICGNHEYYGSDIEPTNQFIRGLLVVWPNITFLDNDYEDYCGYRFIGSVLWDQEATATSNDYKCIEGHTLDSRNALHTNCRQYIQSMINVPQKTIVITHFPPGNLLDGPIVWIYGHVHTPSDVLANNGTWLVCNPIGYPEEYHINNSYNKVIHIHD